MPHFPCASTWYYACECVVKPDDSSEGKNAFTNMCITSRSTPFAILLWKLYDILNKLIGRNEEVSIEHDDTCNKK